jgi:hypothetical protein
MIILSYSNIHRINIYVYNVLLCGIWYKNNYIIEAFKMNNYCCCNALRLYYNLYIIIIVKSCINDLRQYDIEWKGVPTYNEIITYTAKRFIM